ncbi:ABC transporter permease [Bosea sp. (in: a-proteobacteria)]|uniref:ABC transporter permease n=1 Tax=Bosea sp. (in: a-proteobacteria) TaxID=1871050 RepID=UPI00262CAC49|nr:ABC transporter permease [Bosea sp. (in: a-proteobacteria)]MCO5090942.1 ABC transporter permease [Bosea sp. (in: a-proteobacteria)]
MAARSSIPHGSILARGVRQVLAVFPVLAVFAVIGVAWEASVLYFGISELLLPRPSNVFVTLWADFASGLYWRHIGVTVYETLAGFALGTAAGTLVAALFTYFPRVERVLYPVNVVLQTFPKIALAPLLITWFGFGVIPKVLLGALLAFFPVLVNMIIGLKAVPPSQIELLRGFSSSEWKIFRIARFPASLPYLFGAMQTGIVLALLGVITGEFVGARSGLCYLLVQKNAVLSIDGVFGVLMVLGVLGVLIHWGMRAVHRRVIFWES